MTLKNTSMLINLLFCLLCGCNNANNYKPSAVVSSNDSSKQQEVKRDINDTVFIVNNHRLEYQTYKVCDQLKLTENELGFLNDNIAFFKSDTIIENQLKKQDYYQAFLQGTHFLEFEESSFYKENFMFSTEQAFVKNYGKCFIGKFYFPTAVNSAQRRSIVIINPGIKEISIWNFDDLNIRNNAVECDFNVRGKHTVYRIGYSATCKTFIPLK